MMPELGKYAVEVSAAYGVSLLLLAAVTVWVIVGARRVKAELDAAEARAAKGTQDA
ncbi:MAG: heme exporter protein CcmD [Pseudomonadota bacterium]